LRCFFPCRNQLRGVTAAPVVGIREQFAFSSQEQSLITPVAKSIGKPRTPGRFSFSFASFPGLCPRRSFHYQLGIPIWRALGGVCQIEVEGLRYVLQQDRTAVVIDARAPEQFRAGSLPGARNIPRSLVLEGKEVGEIKHAKDDGRLPMEDHNTRIIVIGSDIAAARYVSQAIAHEAFHNVAFFSGSFAEASTVVPSSSP
jgi:rhodanese-related sulfurtransferase